MTLETLIREAIRRTTANDPVLTVRRSDADTLRIPPSMVIPPGDPVLDGREQDGDTVHLWHGLCRKWLGCPSKERWR